MKTQVMISKAAEQRRLLKDMKRVEEKILEVQRYDYQEANELREYLTELRAKYDALETELQARYKELEWKK